MSRVSNDEFLVKLGDLFGKSEESGSVYLTQKRLTETQETPEVPYGVLFRATDGNSDKSRKIRLSTVVESSDLDQFWTKYTEVCKSGMGGLKRKDKKKKKTKK